MFIPHAVNGALKCFEVSNVPRSSLCLITSSHVHLPIHLCSLYGELWMGAPWKSKLPAAFVGLHAAYSGHHACCAPFSLICRVSLTVQTYIVCSINIIEYIALSDRLVERAGLILQLLSVLLCFIFILRYSWLERWGVVGVWWGVGGLLECSTLHMNKS